MPNLPSTFKIPKRFNLFGHWYTVEIDEFLFEREDCFGIADEEAGLIRLQSKKPLVRIREIKDELGNKKEITTYFELTDETAIEVFYHEVVHIILDAMDEEELSMNEKLVNMIAKSLLQIWLTSEYEETLDKGEERRSG